MSDKIVLLLTACINPKGMSFTVVNNEIDRLHQYLISLNWYLVNTKFKILFVENTNYDVSAYFKEYIEAGRLECLTFDGNSFDPALGKGFGESLIIEYALSNSIFLQFSNLIIKITGRIIVENIATLVKNTSPNCVYADFGRSKNDRDKLFSVCVIAPVHFWNLFIQNKTMINDSNGVYFEHILKYTVDRWIENKGRFSIIHRPIKYIGKSGSTGQDYNRRFQSIRMYIKIILYNIYIKKKMFHTN